MSVFDKEDLSVIKIGDLNQYSRQINLIVRVISKTEVREVITRNDETKHNVCEALVADDTGAVYLTLWDDLVEEIQEDQVISITNGYMNTFKSSMRLNIGRYGSWEPLEEATFDEVNLENNISARQVEYSGRRSSGYGSRRRY
ncbi:hypothetical protein JW865_07470 [Candidatus Bathyarchaeota archaeon]|nr:hypothetical protein [Candidatus Bathyarchaeota archaeon]